MQKLKMHSNNLSKENIEKIYELFPNCVTEAKDENGNLVRKIDFDLLKQELSESIVEGPQERYQLNWPGKREALLAANAPIAKTLRPCREESVDFDTTKNLFIEGDNLDALKLLQETYLGKVKMIYIDPPYNTGNDFIYKDDFSENTQEYLKRSSQRDESGNKLVANTESNGRFHSDWLCMMYARLKLSRNLLMDDGVIFISIDDNEVSNIRKLCDEIFGESNFMAQLIWRKRTGSNDAVNMVSLDHDYVVLYSKTNNATLKGIIKDSSNYKNPDNDPRGSWAKDNLTCNKTASERPNLFYPITDPITGIEYQCNPNRVWAYEKDRMRRYIIEGKVIFPRNKSGVPMYKRHLSELRSDKKPFSSLIETVINTVATKQTRDLMGGQYFDYPKSVELIEKLVFQSTSNDDVIIDFFSGSATTAHAVMKLNTTDGLNRRFIMIQIPEKCEKKSEAFNSGYKTIADIGKERIRRAGKKILEAPQLHQNWNTDIGFRVLKIDSSNMKDVYYSPDNLQQADLFSQIDNIKEDRTPEDLLFQVLLDWGIDLTLPINIKKINNKQIFFVDENALIACFDTGIDDKIIKEIANYKPLRVVFRDSAFVSDATKINAEQLFKQISPSTDVRTI